MEHFLFIRSIFWVAMLAFIILIALICVLAEKLLSREKTSRRKSDVSEAKMGVIVGDDSLDQLAA